MLVIPGVNKNDIFHGAAKLGKNDITWGQLTALVCHPAKKVNKTEEATYLSINIDYMYLELNKPLKVQCLAGLFP
jgi:hypothetical protein